MTCWPRRSPSGCASARGRMSTPPPAANGTPMRTRRCGKSCAHTGATTTHPEQSTAQSAARRNKEGIETPFDVMDYILSRDCDIDVTARPPDQPDVGSAPRSAVLVEVVAGQLRQRAN